MPNEMAQGVPPQRRQLAPHRLLTWEGHRRPPGARARRRIQARDVSIALASEHRSSIINRLPARITRLWRDQLGLTEDMAQIKSVAVLG